MIISKGHPHRYLTSSFERSVEDGSDLIVSAKLSRKTRLSGGESWLLSADKIISGTDQFKNVNLILYETQNTKASVGDRLLIKGAYSAFEHARNPGNFDLHFYYQVRHIDGIIDPISINVTKKVRIPYREMICRLSEKADGILVNTAGEEDGGVLSSILLGNKGMIDADIKELYQKSGIAHILAISGLHLSLIGAGLYSLLKKAGTAYPTRFLITAFILFTYTILIGPQIAIIRALIMLGMRLAAYGFGRAFDPVTAIALSAAIILLRNPWYLWDASFQLSFTAVCAIYLILPWMSLIKSSAKRVTNKKRRIAKAVSESLICSFSVFALGLPVLTWHYFEITPASVLINLLVIPMLSVILFASVTGVTAGLVLPVIGEYCAIPLILLSKCGIRIYQLICQAALSVPPGRIVTGRPPVAVIILYYALVITAVYYALKSFQKAKRRSLSAVRIQARAKGQIRTAFSMIGFSVVMLLMACHVSGRILHCPKVVMLDIGQGDCLYISDGHGRNYLVDGGSSSIENIAKKRIEPFLLSNGVAAIDAVFVSHGDEDHINGIEQMIERQTVGIRIRQLVVPEPAYQDEALQRLIAKSCNAGVKISMISEDDMIDTGYITLRCLGPPHDHRGEAESVVEPGNEASVVLDMTCGAFGMLFTGDLEGEGEDLIVKKLKSEKKRRITVLKTAHHGSKNSTTEEFLQVTKPKISVISAGKNNLYGHPNRETIEQIRQTGCKTFCTIDAGAVTIVTDGRQVKVSEYCNQ